jgi:hypothetical protein
MPKQSLQIPREDDQKGEEDKEDKEKSPKKKRERQRKISKQSAKEFTRQVMSFKCDYLS